MISGIKLENYKCFQEPIAFKCGKINIFSGINGRGKSSAMQALLLLSQSINISNNWEYCHLKGEHINLGEYSDVKNSFAARNKDIKITVSASSGLELSIFGNEDEISSYRIKINNSDEIKSLLDASGQRDTLETLLKNIHYVSADRFGPQLFMEKIDLPRFVHVGRRGEFSFEILAQSKSDRLDLTPNKELYRGEDANSLLQQTIEWMSYILDGAKIELKGTDSDSAVLTMLINNRNEDTRLYKPVNIGFGYSYILPLIVAGLIAKPGEIIIVENPEAHLHPRAQSRIAEFYSRIAASGVQVFIETHSEHILNGIRLSCVKPEIKLSNEEASIFFFDDDFYVKTLSITEKGKLDNWPTGFFDQQELDLAEMYSITLKKK